MAKESANRLRSIARATKHEHAVLNLVISKYSTGAMTVAVTVIRQTKALAA